MIYRLYAIIIKEIRILSRDKAGLAVLYLMPLMLVFLMVFIQDRSFHVLQEVEIPIIFADDDHGMIGRALQQSLQERALFRFTMVDDSVSNAVAQIKKQVTTGNFKAGVYVPPELTAQTKERLSNETSSVNNLIHLELYFDPTVSQSLQQLVQSSIRETIARAETKLVFLNLRDELSAFGAQATSLLPVMDSTFLTSGIIPVEKNYATRNSGTIVPNSVQHNVPSWSLFAMFFIVIPLAGSMIQERDDGSLKRLMAMPVYYSELLIAKLVVYLLVCWSQFLLMLFVGVFLMPLLSLPALQTGQHVSALILMIFVSALAATGYGLAVGSMARTQQQASSFGSISVIIAAALGGIWVPIFIMPKIMQELSVLSPLSWALNGFQEVFLRGGTIMDVLPNVLPLSVFFLFTLMAALLKFRLRNQ